MPDEEIPPENPTPPPPKRRPFISLISDAVLNEFLLYQDHELPPAARIRAGHRLLSTAAHALEKKPDKHELSAKIVRFVKGYKAPRANMTVALTTDDIPVRRVNIGGATGASTDIALTDDPKPFLQMLVEQMHEEYYNAALVPVVSFIMVELAEAEIIPRVVERLAFSFEHLKKRDVREEESMEYEDDSQDGAVNEDELEADEGEEPEVEDESEVDEDDSEDEEPEPDAEA